MSSNPIGQLNLDNAPVIPAIKAIARSSLHHITKNWADLTVKPPGPPPPLDPFDGKKVRVMLYLQDAAGLPSMVEVDVDCTASPAAGRIVSLVKAASASLAAGSGRRRTRLRW